MQPIVMNKDQIADIFSEVSVLLELKGENPFKCRAYSSAARTLQTFAGDLRALVLEERLHELPGIGDALQQKIRELIETGRLAYLDDLKASFPPKLTELFSVPGLGPKKIKLLYEKLGVDSLDALEKACAQNLVATLPGMGAKTQGNILEGINQIRTYSSQFRYADVLPHAERLRDTLRQHPAVIRVEVAGSSRRCKEILKDLDLLVSSKQPAEVMDFFTSLPIVKKIIGKGETKSSVLLEGGLQCDLRVVPDSKFAYALHHFTGSKEHNVALRQRAISRGLKLSEWGLFREGLPEDDPSALVPCATEEELFRKLGLDNIPPELRENMGEIQAAEEGTLPRLVEWTELRGTFHNHTSASDGKASLEEMAQAAADLGLDYFGIADHSKSSVQANGLDETRLLAQVAQIRSFNKSKRDIHLFAGSEVDILKDGSLDFSDDILSQLDYVVASVHQAMGMDEDSMTRRLIRTIENPHVTMLGHLTGRLLLSREPYPVDHLKVIEACARNGVWIELNANPRRLDMDWRWWRAARDRGVLCSINPDAHRPEQIGYLRLGINIARKGWLRHKDVANTLSLSQVTALLALKSPALSRA